MVAANPAMKAPASFNKAAAPVSPPENNTDEIVAGVSLASIAFMLATEFITNAFFHFSPTGLGLSATFANAMGWVPSAAAMGATAAVTSGGQAGLVFQ